MSGQTTKQAPRKSETSTKNPKAKDLKNEKLAEETDALVDEIDEILEEDCQTFVTNYIQRGGE